MNDNIARVSSMQRGDRVRMYYDVGRSKIAAYDIISIDIVRRVVRYSNISQSYSASIDYVASVIVD